VSRLAGLRVVDLTQFLPGPMMTVMMADQGATVVKVEPPGGDPARAMPPFAGDESVWFRNLNRGKTCVALDLKTDAGKSALWLLVDDADGLGFGAAAVRARNPRLVYCSISAFGQSGAMAHHPAHDLAVQALAGFLSVNDGHDGTPAVPGTPSADMAAGLTALSAVLMALLARERTGVGDTLDIAMFDSLLPWCAHIAGDALVGGAPPRSTHQRSLGGAAFYHVYSCADGRHVVLGGREAKFAAALLTALARPDLIPLAAAPAGEQDALIAFLQATFVTRSRDDWVAWFAGRDIAFAPVLNFREALDQPHVTERGLWQSPDLAPAIQPSTSICMA
jgi:crotonobetainyl-CoA:carnitine CoA-transferase CaiB-like acyl-CoA transferase